MCEQSGITSISYCDLFDNYLGSLKRGLAGKKPSVLNIFRTWDQTLFSATEDMGLAADEKPANEATRQVMAMLDEEEPESEDGAQEDE